MNTVGNKYVQLLQGMPDPNNGSTYGGLASILQKALMGYGMGQDQKQQEGQQGRLTQALQMYSGSPGNTITWNQPTRPDGTGDPTTTYGQSDPDPMGAANLIAQDNPLMAMQIMQQERALQNQLGADPWNNIDLPTGYAPVDPNNPSAGIQPLQGYTPETETTTAQHEYDLAVSQGFQGSFLDYKTALADAGRTQQAPQPNYENFVNPATNDVKVVNTNDPAAVADLTSQGYARGGALSADGGQGGPDGFKNENTLRDEFLKLSEPYIQVRDALKKVEQAATTPNAASDMSLVFAIMKMIDPGSTVREGEAASVQNARGVDGTILNIYNRALNGETLTPEQRQQFMGMAQGMFSGYQASYDQNVNNYTNLANSYGLNPDRVIVDFSYKPQEIGGATGDSTGDVPPPAPPSGFTWPGASGGLSDDDLINKWIGGQ